MKPQTRDNTNQPTSSTHDADALRLLVVIVNYATPELTIDCLRSLEPEVRALGGVRVVVTDNQSPDDSVAVIGAAIDEHHWGDWATLMPLDHNGGFAWGNNQAVRAALESDRPPDHVFLLNPDTYIRSDALKALLAFMDAHPEAGVVGSRIENPDGSVRCSAFRFHTIMGELVSTSKLGVLIRLFARWHVAPTPCDHNHPTDWVSGAALLIRREVLKQIGLLDDDYFMYYEEMDFCLRVHRAGWACWYAPASRVVHLVGQASGVTGEKRRQKSMPRYWFESRKMFFVKNYGRVYSFFADLAWTIGYSIWRSRCIVLRRPNEDAPHLLGDFIRYNFLPRSRS